MSLDIQAIGRQRRLGLPLAAPTGKGAEAPRPLAPLSLGPRPWKRDMGIGLILAVLMTMPIFML